MISWPAPHVPAVPGPSIPLRVRDTSSGELRATAPGPTARLYVCGITPYDATHLGHAATYVTFDVLQRVWRDNGHQVHYVQNVTDVDDPLLERAEQIGVDWRDLAAEQIALYQEDMTDLAVIPPDDYVGVVESVEQIAEDVRALVAAGAAYTVDVPAGEGSGQDVYYSVAAQPRFGAVSGWTREQMLEVYAERGGDPDRPGKRDALDPLLWRAARAGEPSWDGGSLGQGRPGWHVECSTIAVRRLGMAFDVQGGGTDLVFPHHEMSAAHAGSLTGDWPFARCYVHQGMVAFEGHKISKSRGNLVLVSQLRRDGHDPMAIRLTLLAHHYRSDWEFTSDELAAAEARLERWRAAFSCDGGPDATATVQRLRECLADDLRTPEALAAVDRWADEQLTRGGQVQSAPGVLARAVDALLGVRL
ncbi:MAG TPA: cysteine--1-D-myo-inosityl 2-amino-2-deoxy-alpha-D-glucopyranoside ligase [Angustibacter sp.]|nr:cysteine--1-D-myo-inosityl 2-amino-2-deoxy-alpha-D-glucopyranoside ligase [Angustibacter sp.]